MLSTTFNSQQVTVKSSLAGLYNTIGELNTLFFDNTCPVRYDITDQIPLWVIFEKQERESDGQSGLTIFDFIQKYYDWLYCDNDNGAQYELGKRLLDVVDVEKTRSVFLQRLANIYANGFDNKSLSSNGGLIDEGNLRKFLNGIRRAFYHKKTTEDGVRYFFQTLFGVNQEDIQIQIPKQFILRLNGGRFYDENYKFINQGATTYQAANFLSSSLNDSRLQDGNWIQDWSYLLKVGVPAFYYRTNYLELAHPAGIKVVFEKTLSDYQGPTYDDTVPNVCDSAFLRNYAPYGITFNYSGVTVGDYQSFDGYWDIEQGITFIGLPRNTGCCGGFTGFSGPTNVFPNWTDQRDVTSFKDLYISTMFDLCYPQLDVAGSPNSGFPTTCS